MLASLIQSGGPAMYPILAISVAGVAVILERAYYFLTHERHDGELLIKHLEEYIQKGDKEGAIEVCSKFKNTSSKVMEVILKNYQICDIKGCNFEFLEEKARECSLKQLPKLEKNMWILGIAANVTPLLGLLGTVAGMIGAFKAIATHGTGDPTVLAYGISQALVTTASGLTVAIPALIFYNYYQKKIEKSMMDMETNVVEFINFLRQ